MPCAENVESEETAGEDEEMDPGSRDAPSDSGAMATQCRRRRAGIWGNFGEGGEQGRKGLEMGRLHATRTTVL